MRRLRCLAFRCLVVGLGLAFGGVPPNSNHCNAAEKSSPEPYSKTSPPLKIVGSDTVFPYAAFVGEHFAEAAGEPAPVLEYSGTGAGIALFCRGPGPETPSLLMASRPMNDDDRKLCAQNDIAEDDIIEIPIGQEGIVLVQSYDAPELSLTQQEIFTALSAVPVSTSVTSTPYTKPHTWDQVSPDLPHMPIHILGPTKVSGTYESLVNLTLRPFCPLSEGVETTESSTVESIVESTLCSYIRTDRAYMEMGSNQNLIIERLLHNRHAVGFVNFRFFLQNASRLRAIPIDGVTPTSETLCGGKYPLVRPLYLYLKKAHIARRPQILVYVHHFFALSAVGPRGYLTAKGLIPPSEEARRAILQCLNDLGGSDVL